VDGLLGGTLGLGGEESAGAAFLRRDGTVWTTDKDGIILGLLAAEMTARSGRDPGELYDSIARDLGPSFYARIDANATPQQKTVLKNLTPEKLAAKELAGDPVEAKLANAPGNNAPIGGIKMVTKGGWFAARPSGTEEVYKIYAESFRSAEHLTQIQLEAQDMISHVFAKEAGG
jgi:phosphoglucomutase